MSLSSCSEPIELLMTIQIGARQKYLTCYGEERTKLASEAMDGASNRRLHTSSRKCPIYCAVIPLSLTLGWWPSARAAPTSDAPLRGSGR
jgi:hypothetical protein